MSELIFENIKFFASTPTKSKVVAVPKSIIIAGDNSNFLVANELTKRSAPASFGLSILILIPISKLFSPTTNDLTLKYFLINKT